jgi:HD-like signal output (HDOD) protein
MKERLPPFVERTLKSSEFLTFPDIGLKLLEFRTVPTSETAQKSLSRIIKSDTGLSAALLRSVNSAGNRVAKNIVSVERAINLIGIYKAYSIAFTQVLSTQIRSTAAKGNSQAFEIIWVRSLLTAILAEALGKTCDQKLEGCYTCGLMFHVGMIFFMESYPDEYSKLVDVHVEEQKRRELERYGATFDEVGYWVMKHWNFPEDLLVCLSPYAVDVGSDTRSVVVAAANYSNQLVVLGLGERPDEVVENRSTQDALLLLKRCRMESDMTIDEKMIEWIDGVLTSHLH